MESTIINDTYIHAMQLKNNAAIMLNENDWVPIKELTNTNATLLENKQYDGYSLHHYRARTTINLPRNEVVSINWEADKESAKLDDSGITEFDIVEVGNEPAYKVRRQVNSFPWPCWPRETVFMQYRIEENNITWLIGFSIDHDDVPINANQYIRTFVAMSVYKYTSITPNVTCVQRITNINPNGLIPKSVINSQAGRLVNAFNRWRKLGKNNSHLNETE